MPLKADARRYVDEIRFPRRFPVEALTDEAASADFLAALRSRPSEGGWPEVADVCDQLVASGIRIRVYRPTAQPVKAAVLYLHGGGWVMGSVEGSDDVFCRTLCSLSGCAVLSVDYSLAPEHPYPGPLDDVEEVAIWVRANLSKLCGSPGRLLVLGVSAGGNLAAACTMRDRAAGREPFAAQILLYPALDATMGSDSYQIGANYGLEPAQMRWFWDRYVEAGRRSDPDVSPLAAASLAGLPQALILTAEFDVLRAEGVTYARRLADDGVAVIHRDFPGQVHGFANAIGLIADWELAMAEICRFLAHVSSDSLEVV